LPPFLRDRVPSLRASGSMGVSLKATGTVPHGTTELDLEAPPIAADLALDLTGVGADMPSQLLSLDGLDGHAEVSVGKARSQVGASFSLKRLIRARAQADEVSVKLRAGLLDEVWQAGADVVAARLLSGVGARSAVEGASISFDAIYPKRGDLELRHLDVKIPG